MRLFGLLLIELFTLVYKTQIRKASENNFVIINYFAERWAKVLSGIRTSTHQPITRPIANRRMVIEQPLSCCSPLTSTNSIIIAQHQFLSSSSVFLDIRHQFVLRTSPKWLICYVRTWLKRLHKLSKTTRMWQMKMNFILCEMSIEHCVSIKCDNTESLSLSFHRCMMGKIKEKKNNQRNEFIIEAWDLNIFWYIVWLYPSLYIYISLKVNTERDPPEPLCHSCRIRTDRPFN